ncbi:putative membrane protein, partial [Bacteroides fragilis str. 3988 T1]
MLLFLEVEYINHILYVYRFIYYIFIYYLYI